MALEIRDPIHGFIEREPDEQLIIDCPTFQRLRRLRQLALANLVYPGANHTRFDHSLGVFHLAGRMAAKLGIGATEKRLIKLAALLHDIGHAPFSHVSEPILQNHSAKNINLAEKQQVHELIGTKILLEDPELARLLTERDRQCIAKLLTSGYSYTAFKEIISGPLDADKQDYLLRDSFFCGVSYGRYDPERLLQILEIHDDGKDRYLAIQKDGVQVLEQLLLARYYMTKQVYRHRIRLITDEMIGRGISLGIEIDGLSWLKDLYTYTDSPEYLKEYLSWTDEKLITKILDGQPETYAYSMFRRLVDRKLFKCIFDVTAKDLLDGDSKTLAFAGISASGITAGEFKTRLEGMIAERWHFDPNLVICNQVKFKSAVKTESEVLVVGGTGTKTLFRDESTLFGTVNESIQEQMLQVYAPIIYDDELDKRRKLTEFSTEIKAMIQSIASEKPHPATDATQGDGR